MGRWSGAGASAGLYPLWNQLIQRLADEAVKRGLADDAKRAHWLKTRPQQAVRGIKEGNSKVKQLLTQVATDHHVYSKCGYVECGERLALAKFRGKQAGDVR